MTALIASRIPQPALHEACTTARRYSGPEAVAAGIVAATAAESEVLPAAVVARGCARRERAHHPTGDQARPLRARPRAARGRLGLSAAPPSSVRHSAGAGRVAVVPLAPIEVAVPCGRTAAAPVAPGAAIVRILGHLGVSTEVPRMQLSRDGP